MDPIKPASATTNASRPATMAGASTSAPEPMAPGDEAPAGTPGTGESICPRCGGSGRLSGNICPECQGTGKVVAGIGGG